MQTLFLAQLVVPLALLCWLVLLPLRSMLGLALQSASTALVLFAAAITGVWLFPPWWAPYAYGVLLLIALIVAYQRRGMPRLPCSMLEWTFCVFFGAVGAFAAHETAYALSGYATPDTPLVDLAFPLESGTYLIVNGGNDFRINAHMKTLDATVPRFRAWRGQSYGVDIVKIDGYGLRANGLQPAEPGAYRVYGAKVLAPCAGEIVSAIDSLPDMQVPETDRTHMAGNHVLLRCDDVDILLAHFRPGSLKATLGTRVGAGDHLAAVGNSGNSAEPHLHIHAQKYGTVNEPMSGEPLPMRFNDRYLVRNDRVSVP